MLEYLWSFLWGEPSLSESEKLVQKIIKKLSEQEDLNNLCCFEHRDSQIRLMNLERTVKELVPNQRSILRSPLSKLWNWLFGLKFKDPAYEQRLTAIETTLAELVKSQKDRDEKSAKLYEPSPPSDQDETKGAVYINVPAYSRGSRRFRRFQRNETARCQYPDDRYMGPRYNHLNNFSRYDDCDRPFPYGNYNGDCDERYWGFQEYHGERFWYPSCDYDEDYWTVGGYDESAFHENGPFSEDFIGNATWSWCDHDGNALYPEFLYEEDENRDGFQEPSSFPSTGPLPPSDGGLTLSRPSRRYGDRLWNALISRFYGNATPCSDGKRLDGGDAEAKELSPVKTELSSSTKVQGRPAFPRSECPSQSG